LAKHPLVENFDLSSFKVIGCGAAPLGEELEKACAQRIDCRVYQGYGLTEVAGASHISPMFAPASKTGSVGPALPNTLAKILDTETGAELGINQHCEVCLFGSHVMTGYLNNSEATKNTIDKDGWFHTGDIGYADADGYFYIVDKIKELIEYKGYQVAPAELEALLLTHPGMADVAVIPSPDEEAGEVPKAFVVTKVPITETEIMAWVAEKVASHKKIRRLEFVEEIPKSASGKILRWIPVEAERARLNPVQPAQVNLDRKA
jgi:acyl-CoA synthetase (AMP-forming)/AMP-acid ligase II